MIGQDQVLCELIKLGQETDVEDGVKDADKCRPHTHNNGSENATENGLRAIVIDGSNVAMTYILFF